MLSRSRSRSRSPKPGTGTGGDTGSDTGQDQPKDISKDVTEEEPKHPEQPGGSDSGGKLTLLTKQRGQTTALTAIALSTHSQQVTVSGLNLIVEYPPQLTQFSFAEKVAHIQSTYSLLGGPEQDIGTTLATSLSPDQCLWLMGALSIHTVNLAGLQSVNLRLPAVRSRLVRRAGNDKRAPWDSDRYVADVVRCGGWMAPRLIASLSMPDDVPVIVELCTLFNPVTKAEVRIPLIELGPVQQEQVTTTVATDGLDRTRLEKSLVPQLKKVMLEQAGVWQTPQPQEIPWEEVKLIANLVQNFIFSRMGDYPAANADGPLYDPVTYSDILVSTTEASTDDEAIISLLSNRADLIGRGEEYGKPFEKADYQPARPGDRDTLAAIIKDLLTDDELVAATKLLLQRTGKHAHAGDRVSICPVLRAEQTVTQQRWKLTVALFHELMHRLTHPDFKRAANYIEHDQLLIEGFTELIGVHMFTAFTDLVRSQPRVCAVVLGTDVAYEEPADWVSMIGYGAAGAGAVRLSELLGMDNLLAAYFLGAVHLIGMKKV